VPTSQGVGRPAGDCQPPPPQPQPQPQPQQPLTSAPRLPRCPLHSCPQLAPHPTSHPPCPRPRPQPPRCPRAGNPRVPAHGDPAHGGLDRPPRILLALDSLPDVCPGGATRALLRRVPSCSRLQTRLDLYPPISHSESHCPISEALVAARRLGWWKHTHCRRCERGQTRLVRACVAAVGKANERKRETVTPPKRRRLRRAGARRAAGRAGGAMGSSVAKPAGPVGILAVRALPLRVLRHLPCAANAGGWSKGWRASHT